MLKLKNAILAGEKPEGLRWENEEVLNAIGELLSVFDEPAEVFVLD